MVPLRNGGWLMKETGRKKRRRNRNRVKQFWKRSLLMVVLFFHAVLLVKGIFWEKKPTVSVVEEQKEKRIEKTIRENERGNEELEKIKENNKALLVLVNKEHACPKDGFTLRKICHGRLEAAEILYGDLCQMLEDAGKEGHQFWIASAYRSAKRQQELVDEDVQNAMRQGLSYKDAIEKTYEETMPAGYSEHQTGLALDILSAENTKMDVSQENTKGNQWLREHCHEYGFILRYPKGKEDVTKISYEPWHFRYVGHEAAQYMKKNNLTLEEVF